MDGGGNGGNGGRRRLARDGRHGAGGRRCCPRGRTRWSPAAAELLGGPPGRRALLGERRFWSPLRWLLLLTLVTCGLGFWQKAPCRVHEWSQEYQYTRACYTDVLALWYAERLDRGATPYLDHPVEYPVVIGGAMALAEAFVDDLVEVRPGGRLTDAERELQAALAAGPAGSEREQAARAELTAAQGNARAHSFFDLTWVLVTVGALVVVVTTARLAGPRRVWDAALRGGRARPRAAPDDQLGPRRHGLRRCRAAGLGPPPSGAGRRAARPRARPPSSTRSSSWCRCSRCAGGPGGCARACAPRSRWPSPPRRSRCRSTWSARPSPRSTGCRPSWPAAPWTGSAPRGCRRCGRT